MGLFSKFKKSKVESNVIYSPIKGKIVDIESLKDKTFADKVMGDGLAIIPSEGKVFAPVNGTISALLDTKHAFGITAEGGYELLIHVGQDTVNLKGEGFSTSLKEGDKIKKGDLLGTFDMNFITKKGYNLATPVILIGGGDYKIKDKTSPGEINVGDQLFTVEK